MKTLKTPLLLVSTLIIAVLLLSWTLLDDSPPSSTAAWKSNFISDEELMNYLAENADATQRTDQPPVAEDVLVQRIPGDNQHLLLMAFYSKENYSHPSFTIENGFTITLTDDGTGADKTAGDGLYTAKIPVDLKVFKKEIVSKVQQMSANGFKPMRYIHRELVIDPDATENFELARFDAYEPVSISGLTNALSADLSSLDSKSTNPLARTVTAAATPAPTTLDSIKKNSIFITDLAVIEDSTRTWNSCTQKGNVNGPWTFGTLMRQLASKNPLQIATDAEVSDFVKNWLRSWSNSQVINGDTVAARTLVSSQIIDPWLNKSKNNGAPAGQLDMRFAPFRLTAIVNRFDLRNGQKFALTGSPCGEGRFVFCLIRSDCSRALPMTVILEYGINRPNTCESIHDWAQQWINLKNYVLGSSAYNQALQAITDQFSLCGTNPLKPNQSSIDQVRTNEVTLSPKPRQWELREFALDSAGNLKQTTVGQSPADKYNAGVVNADVQLLANYVNSQRRGIKAGTDTVPLTWKGVPFLGGSSRINGSPVGNPPNVYHWDGTDSNSKSTYIVDNDARSNFSLETCGGCHAAETQTRFTHVDTAFFGVQPGLSGFLTGKAGSGGAVDFDNDSNNNKMTVKDAALRPSAASPRLRTFNDIQARASSLKNYASTTCGTVLSISSQLLFQPTNMVH